MLKIKLVKLNAIESIFYSCICILALIPAIEIPIFSYFDELLAVISIFGEKDRPCSQKHNNT